MQGNLGSPTQSLLLAKIPGLKHGFTNLTMPEAEIKALEAATTTAKQVHKADLIWVEKFEKRARDADAVATFSAGLPIGVFSADCTPLLVAAQDISTNKVYGGMAVHAGWRGAAEKIAYKSLMNFAAAAFTRQGQGTRFKVAIGPCISFGSFEVGQEVVEAFPSAESHGLARYLREENGIRKYLFDLPGENMRQILEAKEKLGLDLEIEDLGLCTLKLSNQFPSYRRAKEKAARILSFLEIE